MNKSIYKSYDELPLFLNASMVAKTLGISTSSAYELMHEKSLTRSRGHFNYSTLRAFKP